MIELRPGPGRTSWDSWSPPVTLNCIVGYCNGSKPVQLKRNVYGFVQKDSPAILNPGISNSLLPCTNTSHLTSLTSLLLTAEVKKPDPKTGHQNKVFHVLILIFFLSTACCKHSWSTLHQRDGWHAATDPPQSARKMPQRAWRPCLSNRLVILKVPIFTAGRKLHNPPC